MQKEKTFEAIKDGRSVQMTQQTFDTLGGEAAGWVRVNQVPDEVQAAMDAAKKENERLEQEEKARKDNEVHDLHLQVERLNETIADKDLHIESLQHHITSQNEVIHKLEEGNELKRQQLEDREFSIENLNKAFSDLQVEYNELKSEHFDLKAKPSTPKKK